GARRSVMEHSLVAQHSLRNGSAHTRRDAALVEDALDRRQDAGADQEHARMSLAFGVQRAAGGIRNPEKQGPAPTRAADRDRGGGWHGTQEPVKGGAETLAGAQS